MDGKTTTSYSAGSCTFTNYANDPWWRVDLGTSLPVAEVVIVNRACGGECAGYLTNFEIKISKLSITFTNHELKNIMRSSYPCGAPPDQSNFTVVLLKYSMVLAVPRIQVRILK